MIKNFLFLVLLGFLLFLTYQATDVDHFFWDLDVSEWVQKVDAGSIAEYNSRMGVVGAAGVLGLLAIAWLWFKGWRVEAFFVGMVGVFDLINPLFRELIARPRPTEDLIIIYRTPTDFSFPSGTAMHVVMFCGLLCYLCSQVLKPGWPRTVFQIGLILWIPLMGLWVIYRGVHWPSDVLGGFVYGACFLWIIIWGHRKYTSWRRIYPKDYIPPEQIPSYLKPFRWVLTILY